MTLYHAIVTATGARQRTSNIDQAKVEPIGPGEELVVIAHLTAEPMDKAWDPVARDYVALPPAPSRTTMSRGAWVDRLGAAREVMLNALRIDPSVPLTIRASIETLYAKLSRRTAVDVAFAETISGVNDLASLLVWAKQAKGYPEGLETSEVPAFAAMMLALPTVDEV